ncbi:MAG: DUF4365 domain-containing protein [Kiritimatiellae bacterium]|nr:DUF4365 domain-containing protein [Kiritimatiellia bacterium]MDD5520314.1 DUF4365 domain-containing protein [Kiritimatiellia bacterium]
MANKPQQHKIDDKAKVFLHKLFDDISWNVELRPDYGIDYRVQILDKDNNITSKVFLVQSKGTEHLKILKKGNQDFVTFPLSRQRLEDYLNVYREPVFLCVVDTVHEIGYWLFLQEYPETGFLPEKWIENTSDVTVYIPVANKLSDTSALLLAVDKAIHYMNEKYPGSPDAAIRRVTEEYKKIDPRFEVKWQQDEAGKMCPSFRPNQNVSLSFTFKADTDERRKKVADLIDRGLRVQFAKDEVDIQGSELLAQDAKRGPLEIQWASNEKVSLSFVRYDGERICGRLDGFTGTLTTGRKQYRFEAILAEGLMRVSGIGDIRNAVPTEHKYTIGIDLEKWSGVPINNLLYFQQIHAVFGLWEKGQTIKIEIHPNNQPDVIELILGCLDNEYVTDVKWWLSILKKIQEIAQKVGKNFILRQKGLMQKDIENIERIHALLFGGAKIASAEKWNLKMSIVGDNIEKFVEPNLLNNFNFTANEILLCVEGDPVLIGTCTRLFNFLKLNNRDELRKQLNTGQRESANLVLGGIAGSMVTESIALGESVAPKSH